MAERKESVKIISWPEQAAKVEHQFKLEKPCPVSIILEKQPLNVEIKSPPEQPLNVDMNMRVSAREAVPICIKLCEPICARSEYTIGIDIFDKPFAGITLRGKTKIYGCSDEYEQKPKLATVTKK